MGFPGNTLDLPGNELEVVAVASAARLDPEHSRARLIASAQGATSAPSQLCCTAWVFDRALAHLLLVRHPQLGWCNPGGHVHRGEGPAEAALRELAEETGVAAPPALADPVLVFERTFPAGPQGGPHIHWLLGYAFVVEREVALTAEPGAPLRWFALADVPADCAEIPGYARLVAGLLRAAP